MNKSVYVTLLAAAFSVNAFAGNPQRAGSAGANELLINPWAGSSGMADANISSVQGVEATFINIAGLAFTEGTQVSFSNTQWLIGSGISINNAAIGQKVGDNGVMSIGIQSFDYGEWEVTTESLPDGGAGTISPSAIVFSLAYAQKFTESIYGGINLKVYNSSISNLSATGVAVDAGVQYITGDEKEFKFGITLKNVGPSFGYSGDGLDITLSVPQGGYAQSFASRSADFELPTQLSMGGSYDWNIDPEIHRLTFALAFISNSFEKDAYSVGVEYGFKDWLGVRAGYRLFDNRADGENTNALAGPTAGITFNAPMGNTDFRFDYAYRMTNNFGGVHTFGAALIL